MKTYNKRELQSIVESISYPSKLDDIISNLEKRLKRKWGIDRDNISQDNFDYIIKESIIYILQQNINAQKIQNMRIIEKLNLNNKYLKIKQDKLDKFIKEGVINE